VVYCFPACELAFNFYTMMYDNGYDFKTMKKYGANARKT
jgi:hypothetical protein